MSRGILTCVYIAGNNLCGNFTHINYFCNIRKCKRYPAPCLIYLLETLSIFYLCLYGFAGGSPACRWICPGGSPLVCRRFAGLPVDLSRRFATGLGGLVFFFFFLFFSPPPPQAVRRPAGGSVQAVRHWFAGGSPACRWICPGGSPLVCRRFAGLPVDLCGNRPQTFYLTPGTAHPIFELFCGGCHTWKVKLNALRNLCSPRK